MPLSMSSIEDPWCPAKSLSSLEEKTQLSFSSCEGFVSKKEFSLSSVEGFCAAGEILSKDDACSTLDDNSGIPIGGSPSYQLGRRQDGFGVVPLHIDKRLNSFGRRRMKFLLSDGQLRECLNASCCIRNCTKRVGLRRLKEVRSTYLFFNREQQDFYLNAAITPLSNNHHEYYLGSLSICRVSFKLIHSLGNARLSRVQRRLSSFRDPRMTGPVGHAAISWMENYFSLHAEIMPTTGRMHLMDNYTRCEVYGLYKADMVKWSSRFASYSHFTRLWKNYFNNVKIPRKVRMGICNICANLKMRRHRAESPTALAEVNLALQHHRDQQAYERSKLAKHKRKCFRNSNKYIGIFVDGMDQKKTTLPHFVRVPKDVKEETFVQIHLVGCLVFHGRLMSKVFFTYPNVHNDPNLTISVIHNVIVSMGGSLPNVLYVQLDNTSRENKNQAVLAYLCMLVQKGVFDKVKVGFLLVGHTHDQIDQMFSTFSKKLGRNDAFTLPRMMELVKESYTPPPEVHHLKETYDFKAFIQGGGQEVCCIERLNDLSFQHQFLIKKKEDGNAYLYGKQYSSSLEWMPRDGLKFLNFVPNCEMQASKQDPLIFESEIKQADSQRREVNYERCLNEKRTLIEKAKSYANDDNDGIWWDTFFEEQGIILQRFLARITSLCNVFYWPLCGSTSRDLNDSMATELQSLVHVPIREMYLGARRSRQRQAELIAMWAGSIEDVKVGSMVATLATNDPKGHPFWIAKVIDIQDIQNRKGPCIVVQWYRTLHPNPLRGKYVPEVIAGGTKRGSRKGTKKQPRIDVLDLQNVDILVYDFELTSAGHLRKKTIDILCQKVPSYAAQFDASSSRITRSQIEKSLGLHRDEDNAIIDSMEEDASSISPSDQSDDSEENGVDAEEDAIVG